MRKSVLVMMLACACGAEPPDRAVPANDAVEKAPRPVAVEGWSASADGMPLFMRSKFEAVEGTAYVPPVPPDLTEASRLFGNELGPDDEPFLDDEIVTMMGYAEVFACIELDAGLFVLRTPSSQQGTTDLVLAAWMRGSNRLMWIADLAWSMCADDGCTRQEAWLLDTTGDAVPELYTRSVWKEVDSETEEVTWAGYSIGQDLMLTSFEVDPSRRRMLSSTGSLE